MNHDEICHRMHVLGYKVKCNTGILIFVQDLNFSNSFSKYAHYSRDQNNAFKIKD